MKLPRRRRLLNLPRIVVMIGCAVALAAPVASHAAEIKVLTSRAMNHVPTDLGGTFERASGHKVTLVLAPPAEIQKRVENGESVDTDPAVGGASGIHFEKVIDRLGIANEVKAKSIRNPLAWEFSRLHASPTPPGRC